MKKIIATTSIALILALFACQKPPKVLTPLEIQQIQSRSFEADYNVTFRSVVSVFQDLGYTIKSADFAAGFITADSAAQSDAAMLIWTGTSKVDQTSATGFVEAIGEKTFVRLNFVNRIETSSAYGRQDKNETPIYDVGPYQAAFEKIENAIFVRKATQ
jgi:hypothetical protein